jgi:hypothetical protein
MRLSPRIFAAGFLVMSFMILVCVEPARTKALTETINPTPDDGMFRVTLNGLHVNNESDDDVSEGDGKRDEVFITADLFTVDSQGRIGQLNRVQSRVMGDITDHPDRIRAGSAEPGILSLSEVGGLRTGDNVPDRGTRDPWRRTENPRTDGRLPMLLWEGKLIAGQSMIVINPVIWEWDNSDASSSMLAYNSGILNWVTQHRADFQTQISNDKPNGPPVLTGLERLFRFGPGSNAFGTRPIGIGGEPSVLAFNIFTLTMQPIALTYYAADQASTTAYTGHGTGVVELNFHDRNAHGVYTLFVQIERL